MAPALHPAVAALDFAKAGAIIANMIESYLAAGVPPSDPEGPDDNDIEDQRPTPVAGSLHLHSPVDAGTSSLQPGEHGAPVQSEEQGRATRLEPGAYPDPRPGSGPVRGADDPSRGFQGPGRRCGDGPGRCDLLLGGVALGALQSGLAPTAGAVRHRANAGDRRGWLLRPGRVQRRASARDERDLRAGGAAHHPRAPPRRA